MPNWKPNWQDVRWDHAAANAAIQALQRVANTLDSTRRSRIDVAQHAVAQWLGMHRTTFDGFLNQTISESQALAEECRAAAARIARASEQAQIEQRHRERERARWYEEREEERREEARRERERQQR